MEFLAFSYSILRLKLRSFSSSSRGAPPLRTSRILHFPMEFLAFSYSILRLKLRSFSACTSLCAPPQDLQNPSFSHGIPCIFLLHTEAQVKVIFIEFARCATPQDLQNPSFSYGIPCVFLLHTEAQVKVIFSVYLAVRAPSGPPESFIFPWNSLHFPTPY